MPFRLEYPSAEELTKTLGGTWSEHKRLGKARCPAHDDTNPSLEITEKNGKVLFVCRSAHCSQESIVAALRDSGRWPDRKVKTNGRAGSTSIVAVYDYIDTTGTLRFQSIRCHPKTFKQRRPDGSGGWIWSLPRDPQHRFLPYRIPDVQKAIALERPVFIVEGEKDVDNAKAMLGIAATCNAGGAGKWREAHAAHLRDADVVIVPDNDDAGRRHAEGVAASLRGIARRVRFLELPNLPEKGDLTDWIYGGGTAEQLWSLVERAPDWEPSEPPNGGAPSGSTPALITRRGSSVAIERIEWVWPGRIAIGKHTGVGGEPGIGKSQLLVRIAATISTGGAWPCGEGKAPAGSVVLLSSEDGVEDTIMPRFMAAGGDPSKLVIVTGAHDEKGIRMFNLQRDLQLLEREIISIGDVRLAIIDPISSYMGQVDSHRNTEVRAAIEPLSDMAARLKVAILSNTHFSKSGASAKSRALHRFIGSIAFVGAPRVIFAVVEDGENNARRLLLHVKNNIAPAAQGLAYTLEQALAGYIGDPPEPLYASRVVWADEPVDKTVDQALAEHEGSLRSEKPRRPSPARDQAEAFLRELLVDGPRPQKEINEAAKKAGITDKPLREARERLCTTAPRRSEDGRVITAFMWSLKKDDGSADGDN